MERSETMELEPNKLHNTDFVPLYEMHELLKEIKSSASNTYVVIDGEEYSTDWGYGIEGIMYFIEMLEKRHGANSGA